MNRFYDIIDAVIFYRMIEKAYTNLHEKNYDVYIEHRDIKEDVHKGDKKL